MNTQAKSMPSFTSDADVDRFVDTADLSHYNLSGFTPMRFELEPKSAALNMRLPHNLLHSLKIRAQAKKIP